MDQAGPLGARPDFVGRGLSHDDVIQLLLGLFDGDYLYGVPYKTAQKDPARFDVQGLTEFGKSLP